MVLRKTEVLSLFILLLIFACAVTQPTKDAASALKERANAYWQHKIKNELDKTYLLELPGMREKVSLVNYIKAFSSGYLLIDAHVKSVAIDGTSARVILNVRYSLLGVYAAKQGISRDVVDLWELVDGQWYHAISTSKKRSIPSSH